jgi:FAD/FMN-containing dehydrogenase
MKKPYVECQPGRIWHNWHDTAGVGGRVARLYTPRNLWTDGTAPRDKRFLPGLMGLQQIVRDGEQDGRRVRAIGSGWSLSAVGFTDDYLVNTARLAYCFIGFQTPSMLTPAYRPKRQRLMFAQCGLQIKTLNGQLEQRGLALPTSGASNGQTVAGAMSTGTHGAAVRVGSMQDYVLGLHVVAEGGEHYYIERASKPAVTRAFVDWLGARHLRDDDLFKAALVSFGSFGLIHGILLETEPLYLLDRYVSQHDYNDVVDAACTLDVSGLGLPKGDALPFHFEIVINPYRRRRGEGGAFVRALYKRRVTGRLSPLPPPPQGQALASKDLVSIAGLFSNAVPEAIPAILQTTLESALAPTGGRLVTGTPGQQFDDSSQTGGGTSMEVGVPIDWLPDALDAIFRVTEEQPFGAPVALRYVKPSQALLAFTRFSPRTCTIEMPGIDSARSRLAHQLIWNALRDRGMPHTYHWGQALPPNPHWVRSGFGPARVNRWLAARRRFLGPGGRHMFANDLMDRCGLSEP